VTSIGALGLRLDGLEPLGTVENDGQRVARGALLRDVGTLLAAANVAASRSSFPLTLLKMNPTLRQLHIPVEEEGRELQAVGWTVFPRCVIPDARVKVFEHVIGMPKATNREAHAEWQRAHTGTGITTRVLMNCTGSHVE